MVAAESSSDFGARLRRLREARGITLRQISAATNISVAHLEALERNDVKRLPGGIFRRGIVRAYAQQVGADPETMVRDFIASVPGEPGVGDSSQAYQSDYQKATAPRRGPRILVVLILLILLVVVAGWLLLTLT